MEIQSLRGRSAVVGWLAVHHRTTPSPTDRLLLNQAAGLITLQLDWPAELIAAYHALGGTLLDLVLHPDQQAAPFVRHLLHFGFVPTDPVVLTVITTNRSSRTRLLQVVTDQLEATARPHVVTRVGGGVAALLPAADAPWLVELLEQAAEAAGVSKIVIGEAYSYHNGSWEAASRSLGVHRQTLRARMARVEELTGLTLDSADNRVLLMLALMSRPETSPAAPTG
jgi:purine catabolism regulator